MREKRPAFAIPRHSEVVFVAFTLECGAWCAGRPDPRSEGHRDAAATREVCDRMHGQPDYPDVGPLQAWKAAPSLPAVHTEEDEDLRARQAAQPVQAVWRWIDLRARQAAQPVQAVWRQRDL